MNDDDLHIYSIILGYEVSTVPDRGRPGRRCFLIAFSDGYQILSRDPEIKDRIESIRGNTAPADAGIDTTCEHAIAG